MMLSRDMRRQLSKLRSGDAPEACEPAPAQQADSSTTASEDSGWHGDAGASPIYFPVALRDSSFTGLLGGREVGGEDGPFWLTELRADERWAVAGELVDRLTPMQSGPQSDLADLIPLSPSDLMFFDIETAGLSNATLFLAGTLDFLGGTPNLRFHFARDYTEEGAMLEAFAAYASQFAAFVTFNGKSFDEPFRKDRMAYHRMGHTPPALHVDVLHAARRRWKGRFADCRLQTLEYELCGRLREGDVPGSMIPEVYHEFVATGDVGLLVPIFQHNALDLLTLAELLAIELATPVLPPKPRTRR